MHQMAKLPSSTFSPPALLGSRIDVTDVSKSYGAEAFAKQVVQKCSFIVERGELTVMIGPSGCGKSTLIRLMAGFVRPRKRTITITRKPITRPGDDRPRLFSGNALLPSRSSHPKTS